MVLRHEAFVKLLGHKGRTPINGISVPYKKHNWELSHTFSYMRLQRENGHLPSGRGPSPEPDSTGTLIYNFQPPDCEK